MNPSEKHILEIDSVELSFGDRRILSGVYLAVETGGVTAVLGRNRVRQELPDEDIVRFAAGGFPVDAHRRGMA